MQKKKKKKVWYSDKFLSARKNHFVTLILAMFHVSKEGIDVADTFAFRKPSRMLYRLYAFRLCSIEDVEKSG